MFQKIINIIYRKPKSRLRHYQRFGGYRNYRSMQQARSAMEKQAFRLPPVISDPQGLPVYLLTGKKYLYQTLFCIQSLKKSSTEKYRFTLVDDGTFDHDFVLRANTQLPGARLVHKEEIEHYQNSRLPESQFPLLHRKRRVYPHIRKLSDIHLIPEDEWKVTIDSDMLFFKDPVALNQWIQQPTQPTYMVDCQQSYGYTTALMSRLCGTVVPEMLNVGIIGLESSSIPWNAIEQWIGTMEQEESTSYFLEQALTAMIIGDRKCKVLDKHKYIVNPSPQDIMAQNGTLHHYVDLSKEGYFKHAWKHL